VVGATTVFARGDEGCGGGCGERIEINAHSPNCEKLHVNATYYKSRDRVKTELYIDGVLKDTKVSNNSATVVFNGYASPGDHEVLVKGYEQTGHWSWYHWDFRMQKSETVTVEACYTACDEVGDRVYGTPTAWVPDFNAMTESRTIPYVVYDAYDGQEVCDPGNEPEVRDLFKDFKKHQAYLANDCEGILRVVNLYMGPEGDSYKYLIGNHYNQKFYFTDPLAFETIPGDSIVLLAGYGGPAVFGPMDEPAICHEFSLNVIETSKCDGYYRKINLRDHGAWIKSLYMDKGPWADPYIVEMLAGLTVPISDVYGPDVVFGDLYEPTNCQILKTYKKHQAYLANNCEGIQRVVNLYEGPASDPYKTLVGTHYNVTTLFTDLFTLETIPAQFVDIPDAYGSDYTFPAMDEPESCLPEPEVCGRCSTQFVGWVTWVDRGGDCSGDYYNERVEYPFDSRCYGACAVGNQVPDGPEIWTPWFNDLNGKKVRTGIQPMKDVNTGESCEAVDLNDSKCSPRWTGRFLQNYIRSVDGHYIRICPLYVPMAADTNGDGKVSEKEARAWEWSDAYLAEKCSLECEPATWQGDLDKKENGTFKEFKNICTDDSLFGGAFYDTSCMVPGSVCDWLHPVP